MQRYTTHQKHLLGISLVGFALGVAGGVAIQTRYNLLSSSGTMGLVSLAAGTVIMVIILLLDRRWYGLA